MPELPPLNMHGPDDNGKVHPDCTECQRNVRVLMTENDMYRELANTRAEELEKTRTHSHEDAYLRGSKAAWQHILGYALHDLGVDDPVAGHARWVAERTATVATLRDWCDHYGDNEWPDDLHLSDVIEKHLMRHVGSSRETVIEFVQELAQDHLCGIPACSVGDPRCHNMAARAALEHAGITWQSDDADDD